MKKLFYIQLDFSSVDLCGEEHYWMYLKFLSFTLFTIEIGISNNKLAGVILNPQPNKSNIFEPKNK